MTALEIAVLGPLAAILVLFAIPDAFGIESSCVGETGVERTGGDTYVAGFAVVGTLGWLAVLLGTVYESIVDRRGVAALLPALWFLTLVLSALVAAIVVGAAPCPG